MKRPILSETAIRADERKRMNDILGSAEGLRNPKLARELCLQGTTVDGAKALLRHAPADNPYLAAMDAIGQVGITGPAHSAEPEDPRAARRAEIKESVAIFNASRGYTRA